MMLRRLFSSRASASDDDKICCRTKETFICICSLLNDENIVSSLWQQKVLLYKKRMFSAIIKSRPNYDDVEKRNCKHSDWVFLDVKEENDDYKNLHPI